MNPIFAHDTRIFLHDCGESIAYRDASANGGAGEILTLGADGTALLALIDRDPGRLQPEDERRTWADNIAVAIDRADLPGIDPEPGKDTVRINGRWRPVSRIVDPDDPGFHRLAVGR